MSAIIDAARRVHAWPVARVIAYPLELPLLLLVALAVPFYFLQAPPDFALPFDDSYISLLFARNLAERGFLTFDGESTSAGATSLLHVALLGGVLKLGFDPESVSAGLGMALQVALVASLYWLAWAIFRDRLIAVLAGVSGAVAGYLPFDALNGMETTLFLLLNTAAVASLFTFRGQLEALLTGVLLALGYLTRPEGLLLTAAVGLYALVAADEAAWPGFRSLLEGARLRRLAALAAPSALAVLGLALFYQATAGDFWPATASAKMQFFRDFDASLARKIDWAQGGVTRFAGPLLPWAAAALFAARRREVLAYAFYWVFFMAMYALLFPGGLYHYWYRYQHPFIPPLLVFGAAGVVFAGRLARRQPRWAVLAAAGGVLFAVAAWAQLSEFRRHYQEDVDLNVTRHQQAAVYVRDRLPARATIATHDIGVLGYYSGRRIVDLVGLINPDVTKYHAVRGLARYVAQERPDYVLLLESWEPRFLKLCAADSQRYELVATFPGNESDPTPLLLYRYMYSAGFGGLY